MPIIATMQVAALSQIADKINDLSGSLLHAMEVDAVNSTADKAYKMAQVEMNAGINLTTTYLSGKMSVRYAKKRSAPTSFVATDVGYIFASRYDYKQLVQPVKHPKRSKGDKTRGIAPGYKAAGLSVEVRRGSRKTASKWFTATLAQYGIDWSRPGSFYRVGEGKKEIEPRYGPSAHQLFSAVITKDLDKYETVLENEFLGLAKKVFSL